MRRATMLPAAVGTLLVLLGAGIGLVSSDPAARVPGWIAGVGGLLVLALALWKLARTPSGDGFAEAPWNEGGAIVDQPPESTPKTDPISGTALADIIEAAASDAREDTVQAGLATVRAPLRETLVAALLRGGWNRDRIEAALADGSWTDDPVAAAVLDENVHPPERSFRNRLWAWLFPGKAVRQRTARAVGAVSRAAEAALPPVVGQQAPRPMPVVEPTLGDLQRAADGSLRRAVEGAASVGAPEYDKGDPEGERESDDETGAVTDASADGAAVAGTADQPQADDDSEPIEWPGRAGGDD